MVSNLLMLRGRTKKVIAPGVVEVVLNLDFEVYIAKAVAIEGFELRNAPRGSTAWEKAQRAAIVLMGSKRVIVVPDVADREQWGRRLTLRARMFLRGRMHGNPVGYVEEGYDRQPMLELGVFLMWLQERSWSLDDAKAVLKGVH